MLEHSSRNRLARVQHESVIQGASEARTEPYMKYGEGALERSNTVARLKPKQSRRLCRRAGLGDAVA